MMDNQPTGAFVVFDGMLTGEMRLEIDRMLREGVSPQGVAAAVESMFNQPVSYSAFTEYGRSPITPNRTVEGSIVEPITDEGRLLE